MGVIAGEGGDPGGATIYIPSRLQVFMSRELFGWPLYGIVLAFGQVRYLQIAYSKVVVTTDRFTDVERDQLPNCLARWFKWADQSPAVHRRRDLLRRFGCLVPALPFQIFGLGPFPSLVLLRCRFPPYRTPQHQRKLDPRASHHHVRRNLLVYHSFRGWLCLLRSQLW